MMTDSQLYVAILLALTGIWFLIDIAWHRARRRNTPQPLFDWATDPFYSQPCHVRRKAS